MKITAKRIDFLFLAIEFDELIREALKIPCQVDVNWTLGYFG